MRTTTTLPIEAAHNLIEAHSYATQIGRPLNYFVTIHWAKTDGGRDPQPRWARLQVCLRHWCERRGFQLMLVWVHERNLSKKLHTHALLHLPHGHVAAFGRALPGWIGGEMQAETIVEKRADQDCIAYLVKDVDPLDYAELRVPKSFAKRRSTRPITGKRAGCSQNLGPKARSVLPVLAAQTAA